MSRVRHGVTARELVRALHAEGFHLMRTRGSHRMYRHPDGRRVVVAYHRLSESFPIGTLKGMLTDIGWKDDDLERLGLTQ
ncbi:MAG: type II toxin-antitoxin system HicA family toxin [Limisphaerales bacterium]